MRPRVGIYVQLWGTTPLYIAAQIGLGSRRALSCPLIDSCQRNMHGLLVLLVPRTARACCMQVLKLLLLVQFDEHLRTGASSSYVLLHHACVCCSSNVFSLYASCCTYKRRRPVQICTGSVTTSISKISINICTHTFRSPHVNYFMRRTHRQGKLGYPKTAGHRGIFIFRRLGDISERSLRPSIRR